MAPQPPAPYYQPPAYQPLLPVTNSQPLPQPQAVTNSQPLPQPQAAYGGHAPVPQQAVVNIVGSGPTRSPSNNCVICMSVFVFLCCCTSMGIVALVLALVARVFHADPSNAVKAVTLNRYAFRLASAAIIAGIVILLLRFIVNFSYIIIYSYNSHFKFIEAYYYAFRSSLAQLVYNLLSK